MGLFDIKPITKENQLSGYDKDWPWIRPGQFTEEELPHASLIQQRRCQMLIHSRIYYILDENLIEDRQFDKWGKELVQLQATYPEIASRINYAEAFKDWDASTGAFLPLEDEWVVRKAQQLLAMNGKGGNKIEINKSSKQVAGGQDSKKVTRKKTTKFGGNSLF